MIKKIEKQFCLVIFTLLLPCDCSSDWSDLDALEDNLIRLYGTGFGVIIPILA